MNNSTETEGFPSGIGALKKEILSALHCALPGTVEAFDPETQTAAVRPALKRRTGSGPGKDACALPLLRDVPVFMPVPFEVGDPPLRQAAFAVGRLRVHRLQTALYKHAGSGGRPFIMNCEL